MTPAGEPGNGPAIASTPNLHDLGGRPTRDGGKGCWGLVYRSTELDKLAGADAAAFAELGIRTTTDPASSAAILPYTTRDMIALEPNDRTTIAPGIGGR